jgi:hypothetical protein
MKKTKKRIILSTTVFLFLITTSIILAIGFGWRIDLINKSIVKTGAIFIETNQPNASIFINGKLKTTSSRLPFISGRLIQNVIPKDYYIEVTKPGFQPWIKNIMVEAGLTTELKNVLLFTENPQSKTLNENLLSTGLTFNENQAFYIKQNPKQETFLLVNLNLESQIQTQYTLTQTIELTKNGEIKTLTADKNPVFKANNDYFLMDTEAKITFRKIAWPTIKEIHQLIPHPLNQAAFYITSADKVYFAEISGSPERLFSSSQIADLKIKNNTIYTFDNASGALQRWDLLTHQFEGNITTLETNQYSPGAKFEIILGDNELELAMIEKSSGELFILDNETRKLRRLEQEVTSAIFKDDKIIYWQNQNNTSRLWVMYLKNKEIQPRKTSGHIDLIGEYESPILKIAPFIYKNRVPYLIVGTEDKIFTTEIETREPINTAELFGKPINDFIFYQSDIYLIDKGNNLISVKIK